MSITGTKMNSILTLTASIQFNPQSDFSSSNIVPKKEESKDIFYFWL